MRGGSHRPFAAGWVHYSEDNGESVGQIGGSVVSLLAGASLFIGDIVYISALDTVNKTLVAATQLATVGVVVGGDGTNMSVMQDDALIGVTVAATVGQKVLVAVIGIVKVLSDAAITLGNKVAPATATTAGRAKTGLATTDLVAGDSGRLIGTALNTVAGAGLVVRVLLNGP